MLLADVAVERVGDLGAWRLEPPAGVLQRLFGVAPAISAAIMAREDLPLMSLTTTPSRMPASASALASRFFSAASMPTSFWRWRETRRSRRSFSGATNEDLRSPARASAASHSASHTSVLRQARS